MKIYHLWFPIHSDLTFEISFSDLDAIAFVFVGGGGAGGGCGEGVGESETTSDKLLEFAELPEWNLRRAKNEVN